MKFLPNLIYCPGCSRCLPPERYSRSRGRRPYGLAARCKDCDRARRARSRRRTP